MVSLRNTMELWTCPNLIRRKKSGPGSVCPGAFCRVDEIDQIRFRKASQGCRRTLVQTASPSLARAQAMARPIPLLPPVTNATLPVSIFSPYSGSVPSFRCPFFRKGCSHAGASEIPSGHLLFGTVFRFRLFISMFPAIFVNLPRSLRLSL